MPLPDRVVCPVCHAALTQHSTAYVRCSGCGRRYPVRDGIPVLIESEALPPIPGDR